MKLLFILFTTLATLFAQTEEPDVATFGDEAIKFSEFKNRFQLTPLSSYAGSDEAINRRNFLYTLVAEKLWAMEAVKYGFDTSDLMKTTFKAIEKMFLRDALFKDEIANRVVISNEEIIEQYQRATTYLTFNFLFSSDSTEIFYLYDELRKGVPFDSIFFNRDESAYQYEPIEYDFDKVEQSIADLLFTLKNGGDFTAPYNESSGWFIFYCREKLLADPPPNERQKLMSRVKENLQTQKTDEIYQAYHKKFFVGKKIETNGVLFWSLRDRIYKIFTEKKAEKKFNRSGNLSLDKNDFQKIETGFGNDSLSLPFIKIENQPVSFIEFLRAFQYEGFYVDTLDENILASRMNFRVRNMIEQELLAREALERGYNKLPEVENDIKMWKESYLFQLYRNSFRDSISFTENDLREFYNNAKNDTSALMINVVEILTDSLEVIEKIFLELQNGSEFKNLAGKYTIRTSTRATNGEFGFQPVYAMGEIGRIAARMKVGEIYGPLKLAEGYSLFQLIGKKESFGESSSFEESKKNIEEQYRTKKLQEIVEKKTVEFSKKYNLKLNEELVVNSIELENLRMLTFRLMGFGGRITAVPLTPLYYEWIESFKKQDEEIP